MKQYEMRKSSLLGEIIIRSSSHPENLATESLQGTQAVCWAKKGRICDDMEGKRRRLGGKVPAELIWVLELHDQQARAN